MAQDFISVIIPNYNNASHLQKCLAALMQQTQAKSTFEIIVVDNGSTDQSLTILQQFPVTLLQYTAQKNPYPCRNLGIQNARGNLIALIDAKCIPHPDWLAQGYRALQNEKIDIVGGNIICQFDQNTSVAEIVYALIYLSIAPQENQSAAALTGNLFTWKNTFDTIGFYLENSRSGADVEWTERAKAKGKNVHYAAQAIVTYPPKKRQALLEAAYRDGKAEAQLFARKLGWGTYFWQALYHARPPYFSTIKKKMNAKNIPIFGHSMLSVWWMYWLVRIQWSRGMLGI
ncbi:MAG: glycosyltransferase family 2 protein [Saprospiraceae bacterium]